ncbi:helix-turn-helix transcriptional regulator [Thermobifida halotolerans]|uniref:Helix-turn-helix transcriptional regulator n=1 Tax=Thermobifida halotolerans TaxID=483545 RepID=A0A399G185_9ACTN|nr:helix-turn-helix transcriptional regulator [Thermobifida halotolerans]UOE18788.1 helix-turn-helix transcriptional regulator [Thermobifida halotolerans]
MYQERPSTVAGAVLWRYRAPEHPGERRVLPDGCMDIVWTRGGLLVAGPDTTAQLVRETSGDVHAGLRFAPGRGPVVLGAPAAELRDARVPLDQLWPASLVRRITERVAAASDPAGALEADITALPLREGLADPVAVEVLARLRAGAGGSSGARVRAVAAAVGLSERQLRRRCLVAFGYGPKTLDRVLRLNRALDLVRSGTPLAEAAARTGYADQPHLTREVRALTGLPPGALLDA